MSDAGTIRDPFRELIEAYALGALDSKDRAALEAHLAAGCPGCDQALEEARWLVTQLAYLAPDAQPSGMLRGGILQTVRSEAAAAKARPVPLHPSVPLWIWGALAAAVLLAFYNVWDAHEQRVRIADLKNQVAKQLQEQQKQQRELALAHREALILTDPRSVRFSMPAGQNNLPALQATWHAALGIVVTGEKLPLPAGNRTLQLWLIPKAAGGGKPIPSQTLRPGSNGEFHLLDPMPYGKLQETKALAITEEPEGGSPQPTSTPIWVGQVSAGRTEDSKTR